MNEPNAPLRRQFRWWREGGFRCPWLARKTKGRWGLGRWTRAEVARHEAEAQQWLDAFPLDDIPARSDPVTVTTEEAAG